MATAAVFIVSLAVYLLAGGQLVRNSALGPDTELRPWHYARERTSDHRYSGEDIDPGTYTGPDTDSADTLYGTGGGGYWGGGYAGLLWDGWRPYVTDYWRTAERSAAGEEGGDVVYGGVPEEGVGWRLAGGGGGGDERNDEGGDGGRIGGDDLKTKVDEGDDESDEGDDEKKKKVGGDDENDEGDDENDEGDDEKKKKKVGGDDENDDGDDEKKEAEDDYEFCGGDNDPCNPFSYGYTVELEEGVTKSQSGCWSDGGWTIEGNFTWDGPDGQSTIRLVYGRRSNKTNIADNQNRSSGRWIRSDKRQLSYLTAQMLG